MGYPHIRGTVAAAEWQPSFIHLWPGIGCPDFLRPFEDTPPPSAIVTGIRSISSDEYRTSRISTNRIHGSFAK